MITCPHMERGGVEKGHDSWPKAIPQQNGKRGHQNAAPTFLSDVGAVSFFFGGGVSAASDVGPCLVPSWFLTGS